MSCFEGLNDIESMLIKDARKEVYIIDSSIVLKWFFTKGENDIETAKIIYEKTLDRDYHMISPDLLIYELLNIFKYRTDFSEVKLEGIIKKIFNILIFSHIDYKTLINAYSISKKIEDSVYDCIYVAMSEKYRAPLITADEKLCKKAKKYNYDVISLTEFANLY